MGTLRAVRPMLRALGRSPLFVATAVLTLALGVGLNAALFSVVDAVLLRSLPFPEADRLVGIETRFTEEHRSIPRVAGGDFVDLERSVSGLEGAAYYSAFDAGMSLHGNALYLPMAEVGPRFFEVLGVAAGAGRVFGGAAPEAKEAVVSTRFARAHFARVADAVGKQLQFDGRVYTISGVMPAGFAFPAKTEVWVRYARPQNAGRGSYNEHVVGRMRTGTALPQLQEQMAALSRGLAAAYPEDRAKVLEAKPLRDQVVGEVRGTLRLLMGAVVVLLLLVAANVTHLQLVRSARAMRATTIRTALGASRAALARRALGEAAVVGVAGGVAALLVAWAALRAVVRLAPSDLPRLGELRLNPEVFGFALLVSMGVMAVAAMLPVWRAWHLQPATVLRAEATRGSGSRGAVRLRSGLLVGEVALTLTLAVLAVLVTRQLIAQSREDLGFAAEQMVVLDVHRVAAVGTGSVVESRARSKVLSAEEQRAADIAEGREKMAHLQKLEDAIARVPGVVGVGAVRGAPMGYEGSDAIFAIRGKQVLAPPFTNLPSAYVRIVTSTLPATMGIPLLRGRELGDGDALEGSRVVLVNQELVRRYFPGEDPIGRFVESGYDEVGVVWQIVGVVGNVREDAPGAPITPTMYVPAAQHPWGLGDLQLVVRTARAPAGMVETLRKAVERADPATAVKGVTMQAAVGQSQAADRFRTVLFGAFAAVSLLLAMVGIYGVTAYTVTERRYEFGLRLAVGATRGQVLGMVLRRSLLLAGAGVAVGVMLSVGMGRVMQGLLAHAPGLDVGAPAMAAGMLLLVALVATAVPAWRASRTDVMETLRAE